MLLGRLKENSNYDITDNGALTHETTGSNLYDMFAMGAAMRERSDEDVLLMFQKAYAENPNYALKCLFYIRDIRGGQGERRFFRVILKYLAQKDPAAIAQLIKLIPEFGRWDDLYTLFDTPLQDVALGCIRTQFYLDLVSDTPSLLAKWMKSENTSSKESIRLANITRESLGLSHKQYRKCLSKLRNKINVLEKLMSQDRWDEIEFGKIPSKAGLMYKDAFVRNDVTRDKYNEFMSNEDTKVNAGTLYPYEVVDKVIDIHRDPSFSSTRKVLNKYWENLTDYFADTKLNALCMVDTSGSMEGTPIDVAISLGLYFAEKNKGPFANHYISFSAEPKLIECEGIDFCDKVIRIYRKNLCENTNILAAFRMILKTCREYNLPQEDLPEYLLVISDMEFDKAVSDRGSYSASDAKKELTELEIESMVWLVYGYKMPKLIFWNVNATKNNIPAFLEDVSFVSGFSPSIFKEILSGKTGRDLMMECLNNPRYDNIHA